MGCLHAIAKDIVDASADFVLGLKGSQNSLHEDVVSLFDKPPEGFQFSTHEEVDEGHGHVEQRGTIVYEQLSWLHQRHLNWTCIGSVIKIESQRHIGEQCSEEARYYIASCSPDAARSHAVVCNHWAIESGLHWVLDMSYGEDQSRIRKGHAVANMVVIRHAVINALNSIKEKERQSIKMILEKASWSTDALAKTIAAIN